MSEFLQYCVICDYCLTSVLLYALLVSPVYGPTRLASSIADRDIHRAQHHGGLSLSCNLHPFILTLPPFGQQTNILSPTFVQLNPPLWEITSGPGHSWPAGSPLALVDPSPRSQG